MLPYCSRVAFRVCKGFNLIRLSGGVLPDNLSNPTAQGRRNFLGRPIKMLVPYLSGCFKKFATSVLLSSLTSDEIDFAFTV